MIGLFGKPSAGKSTFFSAATMKIVKMSEVPFTTIEPNIGIAYVREKCPHSEIGKKCNPKDSSCIDGIRFIPIKLIDVAGLIEGAHEGKGMGNQFLNDLMQADGLLHIVDVSDDSCFEDIEKIKEEIILWLQDLILKDKRYIDKGIYDKIYSRLSGIKIREETIKECLKDFDGDYYLLAKNIFEKSKPVVIVANKVDSGYENYLKLKEKYKDVVPCSAISELVLKQRAEKYVPGSDCFIGSKELEPIKERVLDVVGNTGVQQALEKIVFEKLEYIPVYPVENEKEWSDKKGNILPNVFLVKKGSNVLDLAYMIHEDIGKGFISAIDARTKKRLGKDYILNKNDIIKIYHR